MHMWFHAQLAQKILNGIYYISFEHILISFQVIVNAQALAQICQEYDIKVEKFFEAPSSQIEVSNSTVSQIKKAELKLSGKMSH